MSLVTDVHYVLPNCVYSGKIDFVLTQLIILFHFILVISKMSSEVKGKNCPMLYLLFDLLYLY